MHVVILGAGAVGSVLGARLAHAGHTVTLVARPAHAEAVARAGLVVEGVGAGTYALRAVTQIPRDGPFEAAILATKTFDLTEAAEALARGREPFPVLLVQNGLGVEATTIAALERGGWPRPERSVVRAVQSIPATLLGPGRVRSPGEGEMAVPDPSADPAAAEAIRTFVRLFQGTGIPLKTTAELDREVWKKVLVNAAINPVTAVHGVPNGELRAGPLRREALVLLEEARSVAVREGARVEAEEAVAEFDRVVRATSENRSSMLQDIERGRPTEIEAISGELVRRGERLGLDLAATRRAVDAVRARAGPVRGRPQPL